MKKIYSFFLMLVLAMGLSVNAQEVTFDFNANEWGLPLGSGSGETAAAGNLNGKEIKKDSVTLSFDATGATNSNNQVRMWSIKAGGQLRVYAGCTMTVTAPEGRAVKSIVFSYEATSSRAYFGLSSNTGEVSDSVWLGNARNVIFTEASQSRINKMVVYLGNADGSTDDGSENVPAPVINPFSGVKKDSVKVTITAQEGLSVYYTTNGDEPSDETTAYVEPFVLYKSATVKAIAYNEAGTASAVVSVSYTIEKSETDTTTVTPTDTTATETGLKFVPAENVESGKRYLIVAGDAVAKPLAKAYGYLNVETATPQEDGSIVMKDDANAFTFTQVDNAYTIQQKDGKYLYQTGTYNSFNVAEAPNDGQYWTVAIENGTATITNTGVNKFVQYSTNYKSFGSYAEGAEDRVLPVLYVEAGEAVVPTDTTTVTPPDTTTVVPTDTVSVYSNNLAEQGDMIVENGELPEGVTYVWAFSAQYGAKASAYVKGTNYAVTTWLKTPVIDLSEVNEPSLKFEQCINKFFGNVSEEATLWVCEATEATSRLKEDNWKQIVITYPEITSGNWSKYEEQIVDLSEYKGKKVQIGFRYSSTADAAGTWEIKNLAVVEKADPEGIESQVIRSSQQNVIFDLSGRRVNKAEKGLYIINGKKVLVK